MIENNRDLFSLTGKTVLVTGATGHFGRSMVSVLADAGAHVLINSRSYERSSAMVEEYTAKGMSVSNAAFDVTDGDAVQGFFNQYGDKPLHVLINNAYSGAGGNIKVSSVESYKNSYDVTLIAAHRLLTASLPCLRKAVNDTGSASVINLSTMYGVVSPDPSIYDSPEGTNPPFYGSAKAALLQWTRYAACEFGKEGIRVNSITPGAFPSVDIQKSSPNFIKKLEKKVPMGRIGFSSEMRGPTLFLASEASSYVNGANLVVDGGWTIW